MLYTPEYKNLQENYHVQVPHYGTSGHKWADHIITLSKKMNTRSILDYGAGKCTLQKSLPFAIKNYDPFIPELSERPVPHDIVVCTDVLEHIEPSCIDDVLADLYILTKQLIFLEASTVPASKFLPDGRNAHLIQENGNWWLGKIMKHFDIQSMTLTNNSVLVVAVPTVQSESSESDE
jgi:hypothetical protein